MTHFENWKPKLLPGLVVEEVDRTLFKLGHSGTIVILPKQSGSTIKLLNGQNTILEVIKKVFETEGRVEFKKFFQILQSLKKFDCLENGFEELSDISPSERAHYTKTFFMYQSFAEHNLPVVHSKGLFPNLVQIASLVIGSIGFLDLLISTNKFFPNNFLRYEDSYFAGLLLFYVGTSCIISVQNIIKSLILIFGCGGTIEGQIKSCFLFTAFQIKDESIMQNMDRRTATLYSAMSCFSPFFVLFLCRLLPSSSFITETFYPIALIMLIVNLDPFISSEFTRLFKRLSTTESLFELIPFLRKKSLWGAFKKIEIKSRSLYYGYAGFSVLWMYSVVIVSFNLIGSNVANWLTTIKEGSLPEVLAAVVIFFAIGSTFLFVLFDTMFLFLTNLMDPFSKIFLGLNRHLGVREAHLRLDAYKSLVRRLPFFTDLNNSEIENILRSSRIRDFRKGSPIIIQDDPAEQIYVLLDGIVEVKKAEPTGYSRRLCHLRAPSVFGEAAITGQTHRSADVFAKTKVRVIEIPKKLVHMNIQNHQALLIQQALATSSIFKYIPVECYAAFTANGTLETASKGHTIVKEGEEGDSFYVVVRGAVELNKEGVTLETLHQGGYFGEISLLTQLPRTASAVALDEVLLFKMSRTRFWNVLLENYNLALFIETVAESRLNATKAAISA